MRNAQRGQVLPIWVMGILGTLALIVTALNYGNSLRWHIRAQNAADSAAQAVLAIQSERWNEMMELLYGMNVEEYRIRHLLDAILVASSFSGGCYNTQNTPQTDNVNDCEAVYDVLVPQYLKAVRRYSNEAATMNKVAANATFTKFQTDANTLLDHIGKAPYCNQVNVLPYKFDGGDCSMTYKMVSAVRRSASNTPASGGLSTVYYNSATQIVIPSGATTTSYGYDTENAELFAPAQVDILTCTLVPSLIPSFSFLGDFNKNPTKYYAIGRATATNVMFEQDWFQPGALLNPVRTKAAGGTAIDFQPMENYGTPGRPSGADHDYYAVDFAGNAAAANEDAGSFYFGVAHDEMSARLGWWNSIPIHSINSTGAPNIATSCPNGGN